MMCFIHLLMFYSFYHLVQALSCDGIKRLIGIAHTVETIPDAFPLRRSTLPSTFSLPYNTYL